MRTKTPRGSAPAVAAPPTLDTDSTYALWRLGALHAERAHQLDEHRALLELPPAVSTWEINPFEWEPARTLFADGYHGRPLTHMGATSFAKKVEEVWQMSWANRGTYPGGWEKRSEVVA